MLLRYPGGKKKLAKSIARYLGVIPEGVEFREPFFGSGAVTFQMLKQGSLRGTVWANDVDPGLASLWTSVLTDEYEDLLEKIHGFTPSVEAFRSFKQDLLVLPPSCHLGFQKLAVHQMSYSGLGTRAGSPIGGWVQEGKRWGVDCRWNPKALDKAIHQARSWMGDRLRGGICTQLDFEEVLTTPGDCVVYLDPPYYEKGPDLYQFSFTEGDHKRLVEVLRDSTFPWLLSYDKHPEILRLYDWAEIVDVPFTYTINGTQKATEVLIAPRGSDLRVVDPEQSPDVLDLFAGGGDGC